MSKEVKSDLYKAAGVDIDLATELLSCAKKIQQGQIQVLE